VSWHAIHQFTSAEAHTRFIYYYSTLWLHAGGVAASKWIAIKQPLIIKSFGDGVHTLLIAT
jgi:hypothetical protein